MVWSQYKEDADHQATTTTGDDNKITEFYGDKVDLRFEDWSSWYQQDLMNMWNGIQTYRKDAYIDKHVFEYATYTDFCEFCYSMSSQKQNKW